MRSHISGLEKIKVDIASAAQMNEAMRVRKEVYVDDIHWLKPETLVDRWDPVCVHFIASVNDKVVAHGRLNDQAEGFEIEQYMDLSTLRNAGGCAEISRLSVLPSCRHSLVTLAMFRAFYRYASARSIRHFCITLTPNNLKMYQGLGFTYLGGPFHNKLLGVNHAVYSLDLWRAHALWSERRPQILDYFLRPVAGIG